MKKSKPESDGTLILGSTENSDFCVPVPFVKNKLRNILPIKKMGTLIYGNLLMSV